VQSVPQTHTQRVHSHSRNQEIKQKYFTTQQELEKKKQKAREKLLKNNFQKLLVPSVSFFRLSPSFSVAGALY